MSRNKEVFDANMSSYVVITAEGSDEYAYKPHAVDIDLTVGIVENMMTSLGKSAIVSLVELAPST